MPKTIEEVYIENLIKHLDRTGISQKDLAKKAKISPITLNRNLKDKQFPQKANRLAIAEALGCSDLDFFIQDPSAKPTTLNFSLAAKILVRLESLSELRRALVLGLLFDDSRYVSEHPEFAQFLELMLKVP